MAVQFAQMLGARVIATVRSQEEKELLKCRYKLDANQILLVSVHEDQVVQQVMQLTAGRGVDVVVNCHPIVQGTWRYMAPCGRWVDIAPSNIIEMQPKNASFASVDMIALWQHRKELIARLLLDCFTFQTGQVQPPTGIQQFPYCKMGDAFRLVQQQPHAAVVLTVGGKDDCVRMRSQLYRNRPLFHPDKQYLLVGGLGGLGRTLAEWMVRRGARQLVFFSRSGMDRPEAQSTVALLQRRGAQVSVVKGDVTSSSDVEACIQSLCSLAGIFQAAMVLQDSPLATMTHAQWQDCLRPKVKGTFNLHLASLDRSLDFFVCFASVSAILGMRGQCNYSAANAYMDGLMSYRRSQGLAGSTMNCGMITGAGIVAENQSLQQAMERMGYDAVNWYELLSQVETAVSESYPSPPSPIPSWEAYQTITGVNLARKDLYWAEKPLFRNLYTNHDWDSFTDTKHDEAEESLVLQLHKSPDVASQTSILLGAFMKTIAQTLGVPLEHIHPAKPLSSYGLDSLVAIEFRTWFWRAAGVELPLFEILASSSIAQLVEKAIALMPSAPSVQDTDDGVKSTDVSSSGIDDSIGKADRSKPIPMSPFQARMWSAHQSAQSKAALNLGVVCRLRGNPQLSTMQRTFELIKHRNAILRTGYRQQGEFHEQLVTDDCHVDISAHDYRGRPDPDSALAELVAQNKDTPLDIATGQVMRLLLVQLDEQEHALIWVFHHIAIDRGSADSVLRQWTQIYDSLRGQGPVLADIPSPSVSYCDFTIWHQNRLQASMQTDLAFWTKHLAGAPQACKLLPFTRCEQRPAHRDPHRAYTQGGCIPPALVRRMKRICQSSGVTPVDFLFAALRAFLFRHTHDEDMTVVLINGTRPHPDVEELVGCFSNLTPVRCRDINCDELRFDQLVQSIHQRSLQSLSHSNTPFLDIAGALDLPPAASHTPISQVYMNYQMHGSTPAYATSDFTIKDVQVHDMPYASELGLTALEDPQDGFRLSLQYATSLYRAEDMEQFASDFCGFILSAIQDHRQLIGEISWDQTGK